MTAPVEVIINSRSGSVSEEETRRRLAEQFIAHGVKATIHFAHSGAELEELSDAAAESESEVIVAAGGDGTISTVAVGAFKSGKTLGVLPLGTLNNFSKDLGIPQDVVAAIKIIADGHTKAIDLAEVNDRTFINNSSIGLYPRIVLRREKQQRLGSGKWRAAFWAALRMFRRSPFLKVRIKLGENEIVRKTPFVFVGNNEYDMDLYAIGRRPALDGGELSVYFLHRDGRWGIVLLLLHTALGRLRQWKDFEEIRTEEVVIHTRRKSLPVAFDGEVRVLQTPLHYRSRPKALTVLVPKTSDA